MPSGSILPNIPALPPSTPVLSPPINIPDRSSGEKALHCSGLVPFSTVDFPGFLAAVLFLQGCPWKCRYCHNPHLRLFQQRRQTQGWTWEKVRNFLKERSRFLEGVVFSGGEPTAQPELPQAMTDARSLGYRIGLHTAGAYPARLIPLLPLLDWVGLDIKAPLDSRYDRITGVRDSATPVLESLRIILSAGISYQLRTTVHPPTPAPWPWYNSQTPKTS